VGVPGIVARLDRYQQQHPWLAVPLAVLDKYIEDRGPMLAGLMTYNGFLSLFPLLLVLSTTLRLVLRDHPELADELLGSTLARFPVVGREITATVHPLEGSSVALVIGALLALYGGLGFTAAVEHAFDQMWGVPVDERRHPILARGRGLVLLVLLGVGLAVTTALSALGAAPLPPLGSAFPVLAPLVSVVVNAALFLVGFRVLTVRELTFRQVAPGAIAAALAWQALELGAVRYATDELAGADPLYGVFGLVLALLAWIYLEALVVTAAAEINVVLADRLWPRALLTLTHLVGPDDLTEADRRSLESYARIQRYKSYERIEVAFSPPQEDRPAPQADRPAPQADR
jgi:membrane protein